MTTLTTQWTAELHELFERAAANAEAAALQLQQRFEEFPETGVQQDVLKELEHQGDRLTREIVQSIYGDSEARGARGDAYMLASAIDDVVDHVEHASDLLGLYKVEAAMSQSLEQCRILVGATRALSRAVDALRGGANLPELLDSLKQLEDEGDTVVRLAVASLFEFEDISPRTIIQWKDIFEALEQAVDSCETAGHYVANLGMAHR